MRVFSANLDGVFQCIVAAKTKKRALELLGCTAHTFNLYGSEFDSESCGAMRIALDNPETVFKRRQATSGPPVWFAAGTPEPPPDPLHTASREELIDEVKRLRGYVALLYAIGEDVVQAINPDTSHAIRGVIQESRKTCLHTKVSEWLDDYKQEAKLCETCGLEMARRMRVKEPTT